MNYDGTGGDVLRIITFTAIYRAPLPKRLQGWCQSADIPRSGPVDRGPRPHLFEKRRTWVRSNLHNVAFMKNPCCDLVTPIHFIKHIHFILQEKKTSCSSSIPAQFSAKEILDSTQVQNQTPAPAKHLLPTNDS